MSDSAGAMLVKPLGDDGFRATDTELGIEFVFDRLRRERHELHAELAVSCDLAGARTVEGVLSVGTLNLSSPRARKERAAHLADRARSKVAIDWASLLEEACQRVLAAERNGQPAVLLRAVPRPAPEDEFNVDGFRFPKRHPTVLFGDGGTAKSYLALYVAGELERRGERVAFFDWELDAPTHRLRLEQLFTPAHDLPTVRYLRCDRPLLYELDRLRRVVRTDAVTFGIFDSVAFATDGPPEAAESAAGYFRAARQLGIGALHIAHITKSGDFTKSGYNAAEYRPFGSVFYHNSARATWFVKLAETSLDSRRLTIGLFNRKTNLGPQRPAIGFEITFDDDRTIFTPVNVVENDELAGSLPIRDRMRRLLARGPEISAVLAKQLDAKVDTIERVVRRHSDLFTRLPGQAGEQTKIALVERRSA